MYTVIESGSYEVWAIHQISEGYKSNCPVMEFLQTRAFEKQYQASAFGFRSLFQRYADKGRRGVTAELFHEVDSKNDIWEFVKGDLRIFCFTRKNAIILTHGAIKKSQKVDPKEVSAAVRAKNLFLPKLGKP